MLTMKLPEKDSDPHPVPRQETGYVGELYTDTRAIYMPPLATGIINTL